MRHFTWNGVGLLSASLLFGMLGGCGDNANDVGIFDEGPGTTGSGGMGGASSTDGVSKSSTDAGETESTGGGVGGSGQSDGGTGGTSSAVTGAGGADNTSSTEGSGGTGGGSGSTGGTTASGGTTGTEGTTTGSGGSGGGGCPLERPPEESACEPNELECSYVGDCGNSTLVCSDGHWSERASEARTCASFTHETFPQDGDSCACSPELRCEFLDCDGRGRLRAECNGTTWQVEAQPCEITPCGPETGEQPRCGPDQICVVTAAGPGEGYTCEDNPCAHANLPNSCECARSVCPSDAFECNMRENDTVLACTCSECQ